MKYFLIMMLFATPAFAQRQSKPLPDFIQREVDVLQAEIHRGFQSFQTPEGQYAKPPAPIPSQIIETTGTVKIIE